MSRVRDRYTDHRRQLIASFVRRNGRRAGHDFHVDLHALESELIPSREHRAMACRERARGATLLMRPPRPGPKTRDADSD